MYESLNIDKLTEYFERRTGKTIKIIITGNSTSMVSIKITDNSATLRLQRIFLRADMSVLNEIAYFINDRKKKLPLTRDFIKAYSSDIEQETRKTRINPYGSHFNLVKILDNVNAQYFSNSIQSQITWGKRRSKKRTCKTTLGSYNVRKNLIRINPVLDNHLVPPYVIQYVVYHEMLHCHMGCIEKNNRRFYHTKAFREKEKLFKYYEKAITFIENF